MIFFVVINGGQQFFQHIGRSPVVFSSSQQHAPMALARHVQHASQMTGGDQVHIQPHHNIVYPAYPLLLPGSPIKTIKALNFSLTTLLPMGRHPMAQRDLLRRQSTCPCSP